MTSERFWVIGGEYTCMGFKGLRDGSSQVIGPFEEREEARAAWRAISSEHSSKATARFTIVSEQINLPN